jgi:hypothetical protein
VEFLVVGEPSKVIEDFLRLNVISVDPGCWCCGGIGGTGTVKLMRLWLLAEPGSENWLYAVLDEATDARLLGAEKTLEAADEACDPTESRLPFGKRWSGIDELRRVRGIELISVKRVRINLSYYARLQ